MSGYDTEVLLMAATFVPNKDFVVEFKFSAMIICYALAQGFYNTSDVSVTSYTTTFISKGNLVHVSAT